MSTNRQDRTVVVQLNAVYRLRNSVNGNPRFDLITGFPTRGNYRTSSDAACSYDVENVWNACQRDGSRLVRLTLTKAGRVFGIERVTP